MITPGSTVAVGVSGGKDSMLLLTAMARYRCFSGVPFDLKAICLDMGFGNMDFSLLQRWCEKIDVELTIEPTNIAKIVFEARAEKNPCSLCSKLRRGALNNTALSLGCKTLALGHHADDLAETMLMGIIFEGRANTFKAKTYLDRKGVTVIRPLIYMREKDIIYAVNKAQIPIVKSTCPVDGATKRESMKTLIKSLREEYPGSDERIINAALNLMNKSV